MSSVLSCIDDCAPTWIFRQKQDESLSGVSVPPMSVRRAKEEVQQQEPTAEQFVWLSL